MWLRTSRKQTKQIGEFNWWRQCEHTTRKLSMRPNDKCTVVTVTWCTGPYCSNLVENVCCKNCLNLEIPSSHCTLLLLYWNTGCCVYDFFTTMLPPVKHSNDVGGTCWTITLNNSACWWWLRNSKHTTTLLLPPLWESFDHCWCFMRLGSQLQALTTV